MHAVLLAALHELSVTLRVGSDQDNWIRRDQHLHDYSERWKELTLSLEGDVNVLEHLHGIRTTALLFGIEEDVALLGHSAGDHVKEDGSESLLHVGADPNQEPVVELHGS